ncbi:MAG: hypothetical protein Q9178_000525, partial [Gyalolechia marmorata]
MLLLYLINVLLASSLVSGTHAQNAGLPFPDPLLSSSLLGSHFGVPGIPASYSYIILGGGTAGLTLARRLAANTSVTVAVIEAGGFYETDNGNLSQIPANAAYWADPMPSARNP